MAPATAVLGQVVKRRAPTPKFDFSTIYWKRRVSKLVPNAPPKLAQITRAISGGLPGSKSCFRKRDWTARKYAMLERGEKMPSQIPTSMM
jgi:hypothetical protein